MRAHLGPTNFLTQKGFTFAKGEQIEVTGSSVKYNGTDAVIAREVKKGDKTLTLRDKKACRSGLGHVGSPVSRGHQV
jgi:DNA/RNA endonuclease YhcR with UshA esterase domain